MECDHLRSDLWLFCVACQGLLDLLILFFFPSPFASGAVPDARGAHRISFAPGFNINGAVGPRLVCGVFFVRILAP